MDKTKCQHYENGYCNLSGGSCTDCISSMHLLSIQELRNNVANYHPDTYRKLFASGRISAVKVGGVWYSTEDEIIKYIEKER